MKLSIYQVDAFAERPFSGNPAAVVPLAEWLPDDLLLAIAEENNLAETAYFVPFDGGFEIRWFTPTVEVDLCGHATLASAHILYSELGFTGKQLVFQSRSGPLSVERLKVGRYSMGFPAQPGIKSKIPIALKEALGDGLSAEQIRACFFNEDYLLIVKSEQVVANFKPDFNRLADVPARGLIVSAAATDYDFVCRFFGPAVGVNEDAVTGSAFTKLVPFWAKELGRNELAARQISPRGGNVDCKLDRDTVYLTGNAITFLSGEITLP